MPSVTRHIRKAPTSTKKHMKRQLNRSISLNYGPPTAYLVTLGFPSIRSATYQMSTSIFSSQTTSQVILFMAGLDLHICYLHCKCVGKKKKGEPRCSVNSDKRPQTCSVSRRVHRRATVIRFLMGSSETRADVIQDWVTIKRWGASNCVLSLTLHLENNHSKVVRGKKRVIPKQNMNMFRKG